MTIRQEHGLDAQATRIKCCGMFCEQDIVAINAARPDYCGFVVDVPASHRSVTPERVAALRALLDPGIAAVGVFVDAGVDAVRRLREEGVIDLVQLHGTESDAYLERLKSRIDAPVIKAFKVRCEADVQAANASIADYVLLDGGAGQGRAFDWSLLAHAQRPFFLAGGLTPHTIPQAIEACHPFAVDLSSGLETRRLKDPAKIRAAVDAVRTAQQDTRRKRT